MDKIITYRADKEDLARIEAIKKLYAYKYKRHKMTTSAVIFEAISELFFNECWESINQGKEPFNKKTE